jgi:hypothetical protein
MNQQSREDPDPEKDLRREAGDQKTQAATAETTRGQEQEA